MPPADGAAAALLPATGAELDRQLPSPSLPDIDVFMQIGSAFGPVISPDGTVLLYESSESGDNQIYRLLPEGWPYQLTFIPGGVGRASYNRDCTYAVLETDAAGNELAQLSLLNTRTGGLRSLTSEPGVRHRDPIWSADGFHIYYSANSIDRDSSSIHEMDLRTGSSRPVLGLPGVIEVADVSPDGKRLAIYRATSSLDSNLFLFDLANESLTLLTPHEGNRSYGGGVFSVDGKGLYLATDDNPEARLRLVRLDLASQKVEYLPEDDSRWDLDTFSQSEGRRFLTWITNEDGYGRIHLEDLERHRSLPVPALPGIVSDPVVADAGYLAFTYSSPTCPPDVWIWDFRRAAGLPCSGDPGVYNSAMARALLAAGPSGIPRTDSADGDPGSTSAPNLIRVTFSSWAGISPRVFHEPRLVRYPSFDRREIPAFLFLPPDYHGGAIPFIIEAHGGPSAQFRPSFNRNLQYLLLNGFGILAPNYRGSVGYGREFEDADNYRKRPDAVRDVAAGAEWLVAHGYARPGHIGIKGASYGGYLALAAMSQYPDLFAAGLDQAGIADFETFLAGTADDRRPFRESEYGPVSDRTFLRSISPLYNADRIKGALFVVHGERDPRVPVSEAREILAAVRKDGTPVDSLIFADEGHSITKRDNRLLFYRRMAEFFTRYLKN